MKKNLIKIFQRIKLLCARFSFRQNPVKQELCLPTLPMNGNFAHHTTQAAGKTDMREEVDQQSLEFLRRATLLHNAFWG